MVLIGGYLIEKPGPRRMVLNDIRRLTIIKRGVSGKPAPRSLAGRNRGFHPLLERRHDLFAEPL